MLKAVEFPPDSCEQAVAWSYNVESQYRENHAPPDSTRESGINSPVEDDGLVARRSFHHSPALPAAMRKTTATKAHATTASKRQIGAWRGSVGWISEHGGGASECLGAAEEAEPRIGRKDFLDRRR
jgi:hypothetical protein